MKRTNFFPLIILFIATVTSITISGCDKSNNSKPSIEPKPLPENGEKVVSAQNKFALNLFKAAIQSDEDDIARETISTAAKNRLISPLSLYMDLSMVYNGANGDTKKAIGNVLSLISGGIDTALLNQTNYQLMENLPHEDRSVDMSIANAIWYRQDISPLPSFLSTIEKYYKAKIEGADFSNPQTLTDINNWVKNQTHGKITSILGKIGPYDLMYLLNAIYFKGSWTKKFDAKLTKEDAFHPAGGATEQVPFMFTEDKFNYGQDNAFQIIELPYGNGSFSMYILLPKENANMKTLVSELTSEKLSHTINSMDTTNVKLYLPKWESSYTINLNNILTRMGMGIAFQDDADFTNMYAQSAKISQVKQKTYIKVDEKGTEAAAVTSIGMVTTSMPAEDPTPVMKADHPFLYFISEKSSGSILFLGIVNNPKSKE